MLNLDVAVKLIREFLEDNDKTRYPDFVIDTLLDEAIFYIAKASYSFRKTIQLSATKDGLIYIPYNFGILQVLSNCEVEVKNIVEIDCNECNKEYNSVDYLQFLIEGEELNQLRLCPIITSICTLDNINQVIQSTTQITLSNLNNLPEDKLVLTYITKPERDEIPDEWLMPIVYYVTGSLLRFDKDTQNLTFGNQNLQLCDMYIQLLNKKKVM